MGAALLTAAGGTTAYAASAKTVSLSVDGSTRTVSLHGGTVRDVLSQAHLQVGSHDLLAPAASTRISDGSRVVLRRGRPMTLVVDGVKRTVWVTASSVDEALGQIGLRLGGGDVLSADRSREIPLKGFSLDVRTRKAIRLLVAGTPVPVTTTGLAVQDALYAAHITVRPMDTVSPAPLSPLHDGQTITVTRVDSSQEVVDSPIAFGTAQQDDASLYRGTSREVQAGQAGLRRQTFAVNRVDGKPTGRQLVSDVQVTAPVSRIVAVGTRERPAQTSSDNTSSGGLNWGALANCESGGNPRSVSSNGSYRGLYQFSFGTWSGVGGSGDPIDASSSEQTYRAQILYSRSGRSPWPVCGRYL